MNRKKAKLCVFIHFSSETHGFLFVRLELN